MALETATYIDGLVTTNPTGLDQKSQGDDHIRLLKSTIKATLPNLTGAVTADQSELNILDGATLSTAELNILDGVTATTAELNFTDGVTSNIQTQLDAKAPLVSPALTGTPTAPTAVAGTNTTQIATTAHVFAERNNTATLTNKTLTAPVINSPTGLVKADVGLGNVDNTSDANKPVSTATQTALDGKQNLDADLTAIAGLASTGLIARTGAGTAAVRTLTAGAGVTITNGDGVAGNPTIAISGGSGLGDVVGPAGATDGHIALFDGSTGKLLKSAGFAPITTALGISNTPAGNIAATTVQAAINELDTEKLAIAGGTLTGGLTLPSLNGGQLAGLRNKIINGKMEIAQRGTSFAAIASGAYSLDRWTYSNASSAVATVSQQADVPSSNEFQSSLRYTVTTTDTSIAASDATFIAQNIEGYNARDLIGRTFTVSFWVRSSNTGVHCVALRNSAADRSYITEYTVNAANTWEKKTATVNGGLITAGTWDWTNGIGLRAVFVLATGSNFQTTANAWQAGNFLATSSQVNCLDTIGNIFAITGVQLEVGSVATPFEHRPYGMELALAQRYYYCVKPGKANDIIAESGIATSGIVATLFTIFPQPMRVIPAALEQSGVASDYRVYSAAGATACNVVPVYNTASEKAANTLFGVAGGLTTGQANLGFSGSANGYLGWSAEL